MRWTKKGAVLSSGMTIAGLTPQISPGVDGRVVVGKVGMVMRLSDEDRRELADWMIAAWNDWAACGTPKTL